jgi:hypothetical protein
LKILWQFHVGHSFGRDETLPETRLAQIEPDDRRNQEGLARRLPDHEQILFHPMAAIPLYRTQ